MKSINIKELAKDIIGALDDVEGDIKQLVDKYNKNIRKCLDVHAPVKTKVVKTIHSHPWYDDMIKAELKLRKQKKESGIRIQQSITTWHSTTREDM